MPHELKRSGAGKFVTVQVDNGAGSSAEKAVYVRKVCEVVYAQ